MNARITWPQKPLGEVVDYLGSGISRPFFSETVGLPVLRSNNVKNGKVVLGELKYWHKTDPRGANLNIVKPLPNDMLVNFVNGSSKELGKAAIYEGSPKGCIVSTNFFIVRFKKSVINPYFANLFFQSEEYAKWLYKVAGFSGQGSFNQQEFRKLKLPIPPIDAQGSIVRDSEVWDDAIDLTEKLLAEKRKLRKGLMQQLLTGKRRMPGFGKQASAGKRSNDWTEVPLSELFNPVRRKNSKGVTRVLTASGEHGLVDQGTYFNRSVAGESLAGYFHLLRGEFAYNRSSMNGYPYGAIKRLDEHDEGVLSILYICFAPASNKCCSDFYKHLFEAGVINKLLRNIVQVGARAHGLLNVSLHDFFSVRVPCPPIDEQEQIASVLNRVDKEILLLHAKIDALKEQKKGLMQQLLTGKKRVTACAT